VINDEIPSVVTAGDVTNGFHQTDIPIGINSRVFAVEITPKTRDMYGEVQYALKRKGSSGFAGLGALSFLEFNVGHAWLLNIPFTDEEALIRIKIWKPLVAADIINSVIYRDERGHVK
jgi:hypothetical protein